MQAIKRLQTIQFLLALIISLITLIVFGGQAAISAALGGLTALLPAVLFAGKLFQYSGARSARKIVKCFYQGEALKISSSLILFALVFMLYKKIVPLAFFLTYIALVMTHWFAPLIINQNSPEKN